MKIVELTPVNGRKSFYGKAKVIKEGTQSVWIKDSSQQKELTKEEFNDLIKSKKRLEYEGFKVSQKKQFGTFGMNVYKEIITSPNRQERTVTTFNFSK